MAWCEDDDDDENPFQNKIRDFFNYSITVYDSVFILKLVIQYVQEVESLDDYTIGR